jgi:hypothetical protein
MPSVRVAETSRTFQKLLSPDGPLGNWGLMNDLAHSIGMVGDDV